MTRPLFPRALRHLPSILLGASLVGCGFEPYAPTEMNYSLSAVSSTRLTDKLGESGAASAEAQILGALEMLVGTPAAPQFLLTEEMLDSEIDPNYGANELSDDEWERVLDENRTRRFKRQLALIDAGRFAEVPEPANAKDLWAKWTGRVLPALLADPDGSFENDDGEQVTWVDEAHRIFERNYPTMRESAELYRVQCLHCHGVSGGGDGPTAQFLDPRPRDYRYGKFKWLAVDRNRSPRRADLIHILEEGITFTAMPSFARFSAGELHGLADYVRLLAIRGQVEGIAPPKAAGDQSWLSGGGLVDATIDSDYLVLPPEAPLETYERIWGRWDEAEDNYTWFDGEIPQPGDMTPERIEHGRKLFRGNVANCYTCHGVLARGDGESSFELVPILDDEGNTTETEEAVVLSTLDLFAEHDYVVVLGEAGASHGPFTIDYELDDATGKKVKLKGELSVAAVQELLAGKSVPLGNNKLALEPDGWRLAVQSAAGVPVKRKATLSERKKRLDEWGNDSAPRNLQNGIFRGGGRPLDLYRRVKYGIGGTIMPAAEAGLTDDDIFDIIYYVFSITEKYDPARIQDARGAAAADHSDEEGH